MKDTSLPRALLLSSDRIGQIVADAKRTLETIGVIVENEKAVELVRAAGATLSRDGKRILIPGELVERCVDSAPESFSLFDRDGSAVGVVGGDHVIFDPGSAAISLFDHAEQRSRRPSTRDVVHFVAVTDQTEGFDAQSTGLVPADLPHEIADRYRLFLALVHSRKPIITGTFAKDAFAVMLAMLAEARGGAAELREKPLAIFDCCPSPPLMWSDLTCQALMDCASHGIPAETVSMPLTGATSPVTLDGALVQHTAESLSGIVIHQTVAPGAPLVYGGAPSIFDMRKGTTPLAATESALIVMAYAQIGKSLGLPVHGYLALSDAKLCDYQAGFETAMGATIAALSRINIVSGAGMLDFSSCQSLEKIVLDGEVCRMAKRLIEGVRPRPANEAVEVLREVIGLGSSSFMTADHTRRHFREEVYYPSAVVDRGSYGDWEKSGKKSAADRAHARVSELLAHPKLSMASGDLVERLEEIMAADAKKHGGAALPVWRVF